MAAALAEVATGQPAPGRDAPANPRAEVSPTLVAPRLTPRANFNPTARRRTSALFACVLVLLGGMIAAAIATGRGPQVRVPAVTRLSRSLAGARAARAELRAVFTARYDRAPKGSAISQSPRAGAQVDRGSALHVLLSAGPPPVVLPKLTGESSADARATLQSLGLRVSIAQVPAPGVSPQTVTGQFPPPGASAFPGATVSLRAAEMPRWQPVVRLAGDAAGRSGPFRIRGTQWRVVYTMGYNGTCTWVVFCSGPSATVVQRGGSNPARFDLQEGTGQSTTFQTGAGIYEIDIAPGGDNASWSMIVEDYL
jgi:serine/threonine-protein kinase